MTKAVTFPVAVFAALFFATSIEAHHSGYMYQTSPLWVHGTVVRFEGINPHTITVLENKTSDGKVQRYAVEGPAQNQLERLGLLGRIPKLGDSLEFCGYTYKEEYADRFSTQDSDGTPRLQLEGHVMLLPDGQKEYWEPHGTISGCIQTSDEPRQIWIDFLNSNARAWKGWCEQRAYAVNQSTESLKTLYAEVDGLLETPCP